MGMNLDILLSNVLAVASLTVTPETGEQTQVFRLVPMYCSVGCQLIPTAYHALELEDKREISLKQPKTGTQAAVQPVSASDGTP